MRYVNIDHIKEGMILAKPFYGVSGDLLLREGAKFNRRVLEKFSDMQYSGFYVHDSISDGIEVQDIIPDELRNSGVRTIRSLMTNMKQKANPKIKEDLKNLSALANSIIGEIMSSNYPIVNMIDPKASALYLYQHSVNVCVLSCIIGMELGMSENDLYKLALSALLHDVGYTFISDYILDKYEDREELDADELEEIQNHAKLGYEYVRENFYFDYIVNISILQHHERYDGTGYPNGQKGENIIQFARIIAVADVFDTITYEQAHRGVMRPWEAYEYILGNSNQHFDPQIVNVFIKKIAPFPLGVTVRLSNGLEGIVFENHPHFLTRPLIKVFSQDDEEIFFDLLNDSDSLNVTVKEIIA